MPYCFLGSSIKFQGHKGWKIDDLNPIWVRLLGRSQLSNPSDLPCFHVVILDSKLLICGLMLFLLSLVQFNLITWYIFYSTQIYGCVYRLWSEQIQLLTRDIMFYCEESSLYPPLKYWNHNINQSVLLSIICPWKTLLSTRNLAMCFIFHEIYQNFFFNFSKFSTLLWSSFHALGMLKFIPDLSFYYSNLVFHMVRPFYLMDYLIKILLMITKFTYLAKIFNSNAFVC